MGTLRLREWTTTAAVPLTVPQRDALRGLFGALVQPTAGGGNGYDVTPGNTIGAVQIDNVTILVEPKIPIAQVLFLLGYAADPTGIGRDQAELGTAPDLVGGVIRLFTTLTGRALQRGLLHGYHTVDADVHTVRGRIDLAEQLRRRPGLDLPLAVRFQQYDEDILENRLLLAATLVLRRLAVRDPEARRALHRLNDTLQSVTASYYSPTAVPPVTWTRLNQHLRGAVELARLLLRMQSLDLHRGQTSTPSLVINMADLFETFVRTALREALPTTDKRFPAGDDCPPLHLDARRLVRLKPDLSYWPTQRCAYIGDVKYKRDTGTGHSSDLYQLLAYATAAGLDDASLVYALGPSTPRTHHIPGAQVRLHVHHLDLSRRPVEVLQQVATLAAEIRSTAQPSAMSG